MTNHFDGRVFRNLDPRAKAAKGLRDFLRWQRTKTPTQWPRWRENTASPRLPARLEAGELAFTFVNHITFLVQAGGLNVLTDPVWSARVSPVQWAGPQRVRPPGLPFEELPRIDLVLISHNHYDHLDLDTLRRLERTHQPQFVTCLGNRAFLEQHGLGRVKELDWWDTMPFASGRVLCTPAQHWSGRGWRDRNRTLWGGFVIETGRRTIYFAGDTGYCALFAEVRRRCGEVDVALLPIGAYEPRWFMQEQHMNPDDAVRAHLDLGAKLSIATHFGCFRLTDEGIDDPVRELGLALRAHAVDSTRFRVLETGETLLLPS